MVIKTGLKSRENNGKIHLFVKYMSIQLKSVIEKKRFPERLRWWAVVLYN